MRRFWIGPKVLQYPLQDSGVPSQGELADRDRLGRPYCCNRDDSSCGLICFWHMKLVRMSGIDRHLLGFLRLLYMMPVTINVLLRRFSIGKICLLLAGTQRYVLLKCSDSLPPRNKTTENITDYYRFNQIG